MNEEEIKLIIEKIKTETKQLVLDSQKGIATEQNLNDAVAKLQAMQENVSKNEAALKAIETAVNELSKSLELIKTTSIDKENESINLEAGILKFFADKGIKSIEDVKKFLQESDKNMTFKADVALSSYSGDVNRTINPVTPRFAPLRPLAFLPNARQIPVGAGSNRLMWVPSAYTSNVGYATEGSAYVGSADAATATEKYREFAKIAAKMVISAETFEDLPLFANQLAAKMQENSMVFADGEMWSGIGADGGAHTKKIYGLKTQGITAFDASLVPDVEKATVADLIDGCTVQVKKSFYAANAVWMSPGLAFKVRRLKDSDGQYVTKELIDGSMAIGGLRIIETHVFSDNEMLVGNTSAIQAWFKRNFVLKFGQFGDAVETDTYKVLLFARIQCLVEDEDKKALIYVDDVDAAVTAITKVIA